MREKTAEELTEDDIGRYVRVQDAYEMDRDKLTSGILCDIYTKGVRTGDSFIVVIDGKVVETYPFLDVYVDYDIPKKRKTGIGWHKER